MNVVKEIQRINEREITSGTWSESSSWHVQYKDTAWIFAGNLPFDLTEGDIVCIFSQYGEIIHIELIRDQKTGKSKGFAFLQYEDQRSTILAVDNLNGADVLGRTLRVDHSYGPKKHKKKDDEEESEEEGPLMNVAPELIEVGEKEKPKSKPVDVDEEDPMAAYFRDKTEKKSKKKEKKHHKHKSSKSKSSHHDEDDRSDRHHRSSRRDKSPRTRSRSPRTRSRSPRKRSISPRRSKSPRTRSISPRRSRSPRRRRSVSPRKRVRSRSPPRRRDDSRSPSRKRNDIRSPPRKRSDSRSPPRRRSDSRSPPRRSTYDRRYRSPSPNV